MANALNKPIVRTHATHVMLSAPPTAMAHRESKRWPCDEVRAKHLWQADPNSYRHRCFARTWEESQPSLPWWESSVGGALSMTWVASVLPISPVNGFANGISRSGRHGRMR